MLITSAPGFANDQLSYIPPPGIEFLRSNKNKYCGTDTLLFEDN